MNRKLIAAAIAIAMLGSPVFAETDPAADIDQEWAAQAESRQHMHDHMAKMQATMAQIHAEEDENARHKLMHQHMLEMRTMMEMMGDMNGMGMMSGHMAGGHGEGKGMMHDGGMTMSEHDAEKCPQMGAMADKMAMMHVMMQQMMERDAVREDAGSHEHE